MRNIKRKGIRSTLLRAKKSRLLVRMRSRFEPHARIDAYVVAVGRELAAFQVIGDDTRFDGYQVFRLRDLRKVEVPNPRRKFLEEALKLQGERRRSPGRIDVSSIRAVLEWVSRRFPLVVVHREKINPDVCWIGQIESFGQETFRLYCIDPDAQFQEKRKTFAYADVTRIDFDGGYENALALVAGLLRADGRASKARHGKTRDEGAKARRIESPRGAL